ncbi:tudor domain-containing protein [Methylobacterium aquaticum]|uniref:Uncharacterized protein n=1 Tax=Methylobacterium aquaticum TaxID=270351 RepID=A0A0J6SZU5_9HYPH|nr:hypothetical protein [Methylobacterium aquaticum]KMO38853.1 hypothetical protein VP06_05455 [Methylobacterium aquaticum]
MTIPAQPTPPVPADTLAFAVFGRDEAGKAHGSAFVASETELATKAAELMGMRTLAIRTEVEQALAAKLPRGRVFASGKAFVPFIKAALLTELQTAALNSGLPPLKIIGGAGGNEAGVVPTKPSIATPAPAKPAATVPLVKQPTGWGDLAVGTIVLAAFSAEHCEWYECVVLAVEGEDRFTLRFCDWPNQPAFTRRRTEIGLMHPAHVVEPPTEPELFSRAAC